MQRVVVLVLMVVFVVGRALTHVSEKDLRKGITINKQCRPNTVKTKPENQTKLILLSFVISTRFPASGLYSSHVILESPLKTKPFILLTRVLRQTQCLSWF
jgi:hypothetical protein